jgi:hypothetical protein
VCKTPKHRHKVGQALTAQASDEKYLGKLPYVFVEEDSRFATPALDPSLID